MTEHDDQQTEPKPRVDLFTLMAGIVTLLVSGSVLSDGLMWLSADFRWVLSGGAVLIGILMLVPSVRGGRHRS